MDTDTSPMKLARVEECEGRRMEIYFHPATDTIHFVAFGTTPDNVYDSLEGRIIGFNSLVNIVTGKLDVVCANAHEAQVAQFHFQEAMDDVCRIMLPFAEVGGKRQVRAMLARIVEHVGAYRSHHPTPVGQASDDAERRAAVACAMQGREPLAPRPRKHPLDALFSMLMTSGENPFADLIRGASVEEGNGYARRGPATERAEVEVVTGEGAASKLTAAPAASGAGKKGKKGKGKKRKS